MKKLTLKMLKEMEPDTIFAKGYTTIEHPWFNDATNLEPDGRSVKVKYVAVRGGIWDWKIYHSLDANLEKHDYLDGTDHLNASYDQIYRFGAGLHNREDIKRIVPCTPEALNMYRD